MASSSRERGLPSMDHGSAQSSETKSAEALSHDKIRRATRVMHQVLRRGRQSLLETLVKDKEGWAQLLQKKAEFVDSHESAPIIEVDPSIEKLVPAEFFERPTEWIESQPALRPLNSKIKSADERIPGVPTVGDMSSLWERHRNVYDQFKVRKIILTAPDSGKSVEIVSKRLTPLIFEKAAQEVAIARQAADAGLPTPRVLAEIKDKGNIYVWFEHVPQAKSFESLYHEYDFIFSPLVNDETIDKIFSFIETNKYVETDEEKEFVSRVYEKIRALRDQHRAVERIVADIQIWQKKFTQNREVTRSLEGVTDRRGRSVRVLTDEARELIALEIARLEEVSSSDHQVLMQAAKIRGLSSVAELVGSLILEQLKRGSWQMRDLDQALDNANGNFSEQIPFFPDYKNILNFNNEEKLLKQALDEVSGFAAEKMCGHRKPWEVSDSLRKLAEQKGFKHPDFHYGNIVVEWDEHTHRVARDASGTGKMHIIDWEPQYPQIRSTWGTGGSQQP